MHAGLVAGQRHHLAELAERRQQSRPVSTQTHGIHAQAAGRQLALADTQLRRGIPGPQVRLLGAQVLPGGIQAFASDG